MCLYDDDGKKIRGNNTEWLLLHTGFHISSQNISLTEVFATCASDGGCYKTFNSDELRDCESTLYVYFVYGCSSNKLYYERYC